MPIATADAGGVVGLDLRRPSTNGAGSGSAAAAAAAAAAAGHHHPEDSLEFTQLENLSANQRKLGQLTSRMTSILSSFDKRLHRLERDIRPVHEDLHRLERVQRNIGAVQASLGKTLKSFDIVVDEEASIRAGPNPLDLDPYFQTLTRISDGLAYLRSTGSKADGQNEDRVSAKMHDLLELGARSLIDDVLLPVLREQSYRIDPADYIPLGIHLPTPDHHTTAQIQRLCVFLASLPAHPSTPNSSPLAYAMAQMSEVRAEYLLGSTKFLGMSVREYAVEKVGSMGARAHGHNGSSSISLGMGASVVSGSAMFGGMANRTEEVAYVRGSAGITEWLGAWLEMAETEYSFFRTLLSPTHSHLSHSRTDSASVQAILKAYLRNNFARTLAPSLAFLNSTLQALHSHIRKNLPTHTLFLLDLIGVISSPDSDSGLDGGASNTFMHGGSLLGQSGMTKQGIPARWNYVLSPARLDMDWFTHLAQQQLVAASSGQGAQSQGQGAAASSQQQYGGPDVLARQAGAMMATATAVLTKFIDDIRHVPIGKESDVPSTGINELSYTGVNFIQQVVEYRDVITPLLHSLGSGNWLMGSSAAPVLTLTGVTNQAASGAGQYSQFGASGAGGGGGGAGAQSQAQDEADEREKGRRGDAVLRRYIADVASCVFEALMARSKAIRQTSTASIFVLNNVSFIRHTLLDRNPPGLSGNSLPTSPIGGPPQLSPPVIVADYLSSAAEELLSSTVRQANARYLDAWAPLVTYLMDDMGSGGGGGGWKASKYEADKIPTKERFAKFYESLDDLERLHRAYPVGREDRELREKLKKEVGRMILPLYTRFVTKHKTSGFSKDPSKHIRMTPQEVEERINAIFR